MVVAPPARADEAAFPACYRTRNNLMGAVGIWLELTVSPPGRTISGNASFYQATYPPLDVTLPLEGTYVDAAKTGHHRAVLASPRHSGRNAGMRLTISPDWAEASGTYSLSGGTRGGVEVMLRKVPCK